MFQVVFLGVLLAFTGAAVIAQTVDYPVQTSKTPEAKAAGIGSYHLIQEGEAVVVEAFDSEREPLAECEVLWPEGSRVMTCTMHAGGRFRATWYEEHVEFEDLVTGDHVSLHLEGPSLREVVEKKSALSRPERGGWVVRGTKTWEEVEREWGHISPIFGNLLGEVEMTLGIPAERPSSITEGVAQ